MVACAILQPAAIPVGLIKTCIHTYAALAVGVVAYNIDKAGARALSCVSVCAARPLTVLRARVADCGWVSVRVRSVA